VDYQRLLAEHDQIDMLCRALMSMVTTEMPDADAILRIRADLAAALGAHLAHEDSFIYPRMAARRGDTAEVAASFVSEFADLTRDWTQYLDEWSGECIVEDWTTFRHETIAIVKRLRLRVRRENEALYPAALRTGAITLRPAASRAPALAI
jgi:hypothetical protein